MATSLVKTSSILQGFPKSRSLLAGNAAFNPGATFLIDSVTVGAGGASSVSFSSIPSTYQHLQIRMFAKYSGTVGGGYVNFNSDSSSGNYSYHAFGADGSTVSTATGANANRGLYTSVAGTSATQANVMIMDILDYADTNKYKTLRTLYGWDGNGSGYAEFGSSNWRSTTAVSGITLTPNNTFAQYTKISLYGYTGS